MKVGSFRIASEVPACRNSSSAKNEIDSTPFFKFDQNSLTLAAPGQRITIPMMAMGVPWLWGFFWTTYIPSAACAADLAPARRDVRYYTADVADSRQG